MLMTFGFLTPSTLVVLLIIVLVIFGPGKLPELGKSLGRGISEFKSATNADQEKENNNKQQKEA